MSGTPDGDTHVRIWFDNPDNVTYQGVSVTTTLPDWVSWHSDYPLIVCRSPATLDPTTPDSSRDRCAVIFENSWQNNTLVLSPTAGIGGAGAGQAGDMPPGWGFIEFTVSPEPPVTEVAKVMTQHANVTGPVEATMEGRLTFPVGAGFVSGVPVIGPVGGLLGVTIGAGWWLARRRARGLRELGARLK